MFIEFSRVKSIADRIHILMVIVVKLTFERFRFRAEIGEVDIRSSTINDGIHVFTRLFRAILVVERNLEMKWNHFKISGSQTRNRYVANDAQK